MVPIYARFLERKCPGKSLLFPVHLRRDSQPQGVEPDETGGVALVVGFRRVGSLVNRFQMPILPYYQRQSQAGILDA